MADGGPGLRHARDHLRRGQAWAPERRAPATAQAQQTNPDRVRDYQDRLRALEAQAAKDEHDAATAATPATPTPPQDAGSSRPEDPIVAERRRREYESLFAGNVVMSRRPANERPDSAQAMATARPSERDGSAGSPSIDEIADAAMRATARAGGIAMNPAGTTGSAAAAPGGQQRPRRRRSRPPPFTRTPSPTPARCTASSRARSSTRCSRTDWMAAALRP